MSQAKKNWLAALALAIFHLLSVLMTGYRRGYLS
jgi:hypothetical protein